MKQSCEFCAFSELLVKEGDTFTFLNPNGDEVVRMHPCSVLQCRAMPPIAGTWPQVELEDWCGYFKERPVSS
jgi:hypothetical protein